MIRTYSELIKLKSFDERFKYLMLNGAVGDTRFGFKRYLNQRFYRSPEWKRVRREVIIRDNGCDLAAEDHPIAGRLYVHHMNPISKDDLANMSYSLLDPENLITVSFNTHQAITYGLPDLIPKLDSPRTKNDTCPWR